MFKDRYKQLAVSIPIEQWNALKDIPRSKYAEMISDIKQIVKTTIDGTSILTKDEVAEIISEVEKTI